MSPVRVSVLLPVGPDAPWLQETLASLTTQTYANWELIVVLDGNPHQNRETIEAAGLKAPTTIIEHSTSQGIARSLNAALHRASGDLIARIDADDLNLPSRLEKQVAEFDKDDELVLLGTSANVINHLGQSAGKPRIVPTGDHALKKRLLTRNSFIHPSVMFRKNVAILIGGYNVHCTRTEDYEFWLRLAICGRIDNLPEPLINYRIHEGQHTSGKHGISKKESDILLATKIKLAKSMQVHPLAVRMFHAIWRWNRTPHTLWKLNTK